MVIIILVEPVEFFGFDCIEMVYDSALGIYILSN